jgi:iron complex transport system ATP-binding protein
VTAGSALQLEGVTFGHAGKPLLRGIELALGFGEVLALAGRNGAGKTTLLRIAAGLIAPSAGRVLLAGRPLAGLRRRDIALALALVPQDTTVPFPFSALEIVLLGRAPHKRALGFESRADRALAHAALERLGMAALAERNVQELSGGERQLVAIARALAQQPRVLLLDEPVAHLDLAHRLALESLLRELVRDGCAALLVSHDLAGAARVADRVALLADGRILGCGAARDVLGPDALRAAFGVEARLIETDDGPVVIPRRAG